MSKFMASVVIPIYNQFSSLQIVLRSFSNQTVPNTSFEIILIDDGSEDDIRELSSQILSKQFNLNITLLHQTNAGRAFSRNQGILLSQSDIIIFCDSDRIPATNFIEQHLLYQLQGKEIVIGKSCDYFGPASAIEVNFDWDVIHKLSKIPSYYKRIFSIYEDSKPCTSNLAWLSFLVGNSSITKQILNKIGGFDESFIDWGFEHFELALRIQEENYSFYFNDKAKSFHIPHPRSHQFYANKINKNIEKIVQKHPKINKKVLKQILLDDIPLEWLENKLFYNLD